MFRTLARLIRDPALNNPTASDPDTVFAIHPMQLSRWLEEIWAGGGMTHWPAVSAVGAPGGNLQLPGLATSGPRFQLPTGLRDQTLRSGIRPPMPPVLPPVFEPRLPPALGVDFGPLPSEHLFHAYLVESTGIVDVLAEVVRRYVVGETLPTPSLDTLVWVRTTEELFFREPPLFHIGGLTSQLRPDPQVNRRNAYWRMFGCDLPHSPRGLADAQQPWKRDIGPVANTRFIELWNELLRQVWIGIENDANQVGANPTDSSYVGYLCQTIGELLRLRRQNGMLMREEYIYNAMLDWMLLTVEFDTAVVHTLSATASAGGNPADRLAGIGAHVGITPPRNARELFELADLVSPVLWFIELRQFDAPGNAELLYRKFNGANPTIPATMNRIVDLWQSVTGEPLKANVVPVQRTSTPARQQAQPTRLPTATMPASQQVASSTNGRSTASRV